MPTRSLIDTPEVEYLDGQAYPKVSPKTDHFVVAGNLAAIMRRCAHDRGPVGPELHVYPGKVDRTETVFVPDLAFVSWERLRVLPKTERQEPPSPDIAVEVRSPSVDLRYLARKIERFLATGTLLVLDVDPPTRSIHAHDGAGTQSYQAGDTFERDAVPWLRFDVSEAFAGLDRL